MNSVRSTLKQLGLGRKNESEQVYWQLFQNLPAAVYTCDAQGYIEVYNEAAVNLWGRKPEVGKDLWCGSWRIFSPDGIPVPLDTCPMAITLKEGRPVEGEEIVVERPDGTRRNVLPHPKPIFNSKGELTGAFNMLVDITDYKRLKEAHLRLEQLNAELEQFAYAASHDMQEPLRKIQTYASRLLTCNTDQLNERGKSDLVKISDSADRMKSIIKDLLNYSHRIKTKEDFETVNLNEVLAHVKLDLELLIQQKKAVIINDYLPAVNAIPIQINQLFYNLINNALKFSKPDVPPVIQVTVRHNDDDEMENDFVEIEVRDNGIGFDPKYAIAIFRLFQRLVDRNAYSGTGIGLALCKKIVENHDGDICAESEPGNGAIFRVKLKK